MNGAQALSICMLSEDFLPAATGVGIHLQSVTVHLAGLGHQVTVLTTRRPGEPEFEVWRGVRVYRVRTVRVFGFYQAVASSATLRGLLDWIRPDVVHCHYLGFMLLRAGPVIRKRGWAHTYTYHMTADHLTQPWPMRPLRRWIERAIVEYCNGTDLVIAVSRNLADSLVAQRRIHTPVRYISNPVDFPAVESIEPAPRGAGFAVMFAGRLDPEKNIPFLLRGFKRLLDHVPGAVLWIAGAGAQRPRLQRWVLEEGLAANVEFLGFLDRPELLRRYAACDVFVLPSLVETQGLVAMEAMHLGKPVIVARTVVSADELVDEGRNGYLVGQDADEELADRLMRLAADPALRASMGAAGRRKAVAYAPAGIAAQLAQAYRAALAVRRAGR